MFKQLSSIRSKENQEKKLGSRLFVVSLLFFCSNMGLEMARIKRDSYFLVDAGPSEIPKMYIFMAFLMLTGSIIYSSLVDRFRRDTLQSILFVIGFIIAISSYIILHFELNIPYFSYVLFCVVEAYVGFVLMHFWNFMSYVFDDEEGKLTYPVIGALGLLGTIFAGLSTKIVVGLFGIDTLLLIWAALCLVSLFLIKKIYYLVLNTGHSGDTLMDFDDSPKTTFGLDSFKVLLKNPLMRTMIYLSFPIWFIIYIIEFNFYHSMNRVYSNQDDLAGFLGLFGSFACFCGLVIQLTVTPYLIKKLGVGATSMLFPFSLALGSLSLLIFSLFPAAVGGELVMPGIVLLVVFARFCDIAIYFSVYESTSQLIYYAVSEKMRSKARAMISGVFTPVCTALAGCVLILFQKMDEPIYNIAFVSVSLAFGLIVFGLKITPDYLKSMISSVDVSDIGQRDKITREISKLQTSDVRYVLISSLTSDIDYEAFFAAKKLFEIKDEELFFDIEEVADALKPSVKYLIAKLMTAEDIEKHSLLHLKLTQPS